MQGRYRPLDGPLEPDERACQIIDGVRQHDLLDAGAMLDYMAQLWSQRR